MSQPSLSSVSDATITAIAYIVVAIICIPMLVLRGPGVKL